ncbi:MAG: hypothetical protein HQK57_06995 [Deltaproteobacteria bacterium]|nr:hypothetical protein [Deltaproteobacteria bacterium]MBF0524476.1 hypothetical protein [Deltaproteobacteria bacterium]
MIADKFRNRGVPVIIGGPHTYFYDREAAEHADAVGIGEGESIWPKMRPRADFKKSTAATNRIVCKADLASWVVNLSQRKAAHADETMVNFDNY